MAKNALAMYVTFVLATGGGTATISRLDVVLVAVGAGCIVEEVVLDVECEEDEEEADLRRRAEDESVAVRPAEEVDREGTLVGVGRTM